MHIQNKLTDFARAVSSDADELISRTVLKATGQHFDDYVASGGVPPLSLFFKAYAVSTVHHAKRIIWAPAALGLDAQTPRTGELFDADGQKIGSTHYTRELDQA